MELTTQPTTETDHDAEKLFKEMLEERQYRTPKPTFCVEQATKEHGALAWALAMGYVKKVKRTVVERKNDANVVFLYYRYIGE